MAPFESLETRHALLVFTGFPGDTATLPSWASDVFDPGREGSLTHFYDEMSFGGLKVSGSVAPQRYISSRDAISYASEDHTGLGRFGEFVAEVVAMADDDIDFAQFDSDGPDGLPNSGDDDGVVDMLFVVTPAVPRNFLLGSATGIASLGLTRDLETDDQTIDGAPVRISSRNGTVQVGRSFSKTVGVLAHEVGHLLGLPDLFNTNWIRSTEPLGPMLDSAGIGAWGLMGWGASGWNGNDGPNSFSAWSRVQLGWTQVMDLDQLRQEIELEDIGRGERVYRIPLGATESYLLEYRRRDGSYYDRNIPEEGLLIWHQVLELGQILDLECADGRWRDAGFPLGSVPAPETGQDNLDFWAHDQDYAHAHSGNLGDATDIFDGLRFTSFTPEGNPSSRTKRGLTPRIEGIRQEGSRLRALVSLNPARLSVVQFALLDSTDDGVVEPGESAQLRFGLVNRGGIVARDVRVVFDTGEALRVEPEVLQYLDVDVTGYQGAPTRPSLTLTGPLVGARTIPLTMRMLTDGEEVGRDTFRIEVATPRQRVVGVTVIDSAGNGDGVAQKGEIVQVSARLEVSSAAAMRALRFSMAKLDSDVVCLSTDRVTFVQESDSTVIAAVMPEFLLPSDLPSGRRLEFELQATGTFESWLDTLTVEVGEGLDETAPRVTSLRVQTTGDGLLIRVEGRWILESSDVHEVWAIIRSLDGSADLAVLPLAREDTWYEGVWTGEPGAYQVRVEAVDASGNTGRSPARSATLLQGSSLGAGTFTVGGEWREVDLPLDERDGMVTDVAIAPTDPNVWYATTLSGLHRSEDGGRTWIRTGLMFNGVSISEE